MFWAGYSLSFLCWSSPCYLSPFFLALLWSSSAFLSCDIWVHLNYRIDLSLVRKKGLLLSLDKAILTLALPQIAHKLRQSLGKWQTTFGLNSVQRLGFTDKQTHQEWVYMNQFLFLHIHIYIYIQTYTHTNLMLLGNSEHSKLNENPFYKETENCCFRQAVQQLWRSSHVNHII